MVLDLSFVGSQSRNLNTQVNLNAPAYGAAYCPENQDPTAAASTIPGATALSVDFLRPYRGFGDIIQIQPTAYADYKSLQTSREPPVQQRLLLRGQLRARQGHGHVEHRLPGRQQHVQSTASSGCPAPTARRTSARRTTCRSTPIGVIRWTANFVWQLPNAEVDNKVLAGVIHDWQVSGVYRAGSGAPYTVTYNIPGISPYTMTGTQRLESGRVVITGDPGSGYSDDPYQQFNPSAFTTPKPNSDGLESGTNYLNYQPVYTLDLLRRALRPLRRQSPAGVPRGHVQRLQQLHHHGREQRSCRCAAWPIRRRPTWHATRPAISSTPTGSARSPRWHPLVRFS